MLVFLCSQMCGLSISFVLLFFFNVTATTEIYTYGHTLSLHDALPICAGFAIGLNRRQWAFVHAQLGRRTARSGPGIVVAVRTLARLRQGRARRTQGRPCHLERTRSRAIDRKSVVSGKSVSVRVDIGGRRIIKKKKSKQRYNNTTKNT